MPQNIDCLNVRGQKVSTEEVLSAIDRLKSRYVLIADNTGMANRIARERPGVQVVYRDFWPRPDFGDDDLHLFTTPAAWIARMNGLGLDPGIWWYSGNEPTGEWARLAGWIEQVIPLANTVGRHLVVGNFSVGVPEPEDWNGPLLPVLKVLRDGKHTLGLHEYMVESCAASQPHYVARFLKAWDAASRAGYARPHTLITEAGFDLRGSWVIQCQGSAARFAQEFQKAAKLYYLHGIDGVFHFSFGPWSRGKPGEPGYTGDFDVRPALAELAKVTTPVPTIYTPPQEEPMPEIPEVWIPAIAQPKGSYTVNIRAAASAGAADVGDLVAGDAVEFVPVQGDWWKVRKGRVTGWAHVGYVGFVPNLTPQADGETQARIAELEAQVTALEAQVSELTDQVEELDQQAAIGRQFTALVGLVTGAKAVVEMRDHPF